MCVTCSVNYMNLLREESRPAQAKLSLCDALRGRTSEFVCDLRPTWSRCEMHSPSNSYLCCCRTHKGSLQCSFQACSSWLMNELLTEVAEEMLRPLSIIIRCASFPVCRCSKSEVFSFPKYKWKLRQTIDELFWLGSNRETNIRKIVRKQRRTSFGKFSVDSSKWISRT